MVIALQLRRLVLFLVWFSLFTVVVVIVTSRGENGYAQPALAAQQAPPCPGLVSGIRATGEYNRVPQEDVVINGELWGGPDWAPGHRSFWHCHSGGQILVIWEGEGQIQNRGERVRIIRRGEMSVATRGLEHWHGAGPDEHGHWMQVSVRPSGVFWMEEVGDEDFLGNDIGINSRNEFMRTGVQEKYPMR